MSGVALVSFTNVDINALCPLMRKALDRSVSANADASGAVPPLHHMLCIANIKDKNVKNAAALKPYLNLFHAGFIFAAYHEDMAEILEITGLPCILTETTNRAVGCAYIVGSVSQWRDALLRGGTPVVSTEVRHIFNLVYKEFGKIGLANALDIAMTKERPDHTYLIEHKK